jgi:hypothetical protein
MALSKTPKDIRELVGKRFFGVKFIKKTDNSIRTMLCKIGVKNWNGQSQIKGGGLKYNPESKGLLPVWDVNKGAYRMVNINTLLELRFKGKTFKF